MKFNKKNIYITLFGILYGGVALVSLIHAVSFFALANLLWLAILLAVIFEIGQSAVLFSILTSSTGKSKVMPWILMCILTAVQILGNVFSSYKYIVSNSPENLRFFKEPVFIWTDIPDAQATVIITYIVGGILPLVALAMSAMVTNYLEDEKDKNNEAPEAPMVLNDENPLINQNSMLHMENQGLQESNKKKDEEIEQLRKQIEELNNKKDGESGDITTEESESNNDNGGQQMGTDEDQTTTESPITENIKPKIGEIPNETTGENSIKTDESETKLEGDKSDDGKDDLKEEIPHKPSVEIKEDVTKQPSHFINL